MKRKKSNSSSNQEFEKIDDIISLLRFSIAVELFKLDLPQQQIAKRLGVAKKSVNTMLQGIKKSKGNGK